MFPRLLALILVVGLAGCGMSRLDRYRALSPASKEVYDKYYQFMTEAQQDRYMEAKSDEERQRMVADLHVEERLARYPDYVQKAIWSREIVNGMDKPAVLLTWGKPDGIERANLEETKGVEQEVWTYKRGGEQAGQRTRLQIVQGVVTAVERE